MCAALVAPVALAAVFAPAAHAECEKVRWETRWQPDPFGTSGGSLTQVPVCQDDDAPSTKPTKKAKPDEPTRSQLRALRYRPSDAVSATVRQRMIEQVAHGEQADEARAMIGAGDLMRQFDASIREQDWSTRDLGDMYTMAYIQLWLVANNQTKISTPIVKAVRQDLRRQLALDPKVSEADDATQQETAEWLGSWTVMLAGYINHLRTLGDPARIEEHRQNVRELVRARDLLSVDLTQIRLTRRGIAPR